MSGELLSGIGNSRSGGELFGIYELVVFYICGII